MEPESIHAGGGWGAHHVAYLGLESSMGRSELRVWNALLARSGPSGSWPSVHTVAADTRMDRRTAQRALAGLEQLGAISRESRTGTTTRYRLIPPDQVASLGVVQQARDAVRAVASKPRPRNTAEVTVQHHDQQQPSQPAKVAPLPVDLPPLPAGFAKRETLEDARSLVRASARSAATPPVTDADRRRELQEADDPWALLERWDHPPTPPPPPAPAAPAAAPPPRAAHGKHDPKPIGFVMRDTLEEARTTARAPMPAPRAQPPPQASAPPRPPAPPLTGPMAAKLERLAAGHGLDMGPEPQPPPAHVRPAAPPPPRPPGKNPETDEEVEAELRRQGKHPEAIRLTLEAMRQARASPRGLTAPWPFAQAAVKRAEAQLAEDDERRARIRAEQDAALEASLAEQRKPCGVHGTPSCKECAFAVVMHMREQAGISSSPREHPAANATAPPAQRQPPCGVCGYRAISPGPCLACERNLRLVS